MNVHAFVNVRVIFCVLCLHLASSFACSFLLFCCADVSLQDMVMPTETEGGDHTLDETDTTEDEAGERARGSVPEDMFADADAGHAAPPVPTSPSSQQNPHPHHKHHGHHKRRHGRNRLANESGAGTGGQQVEHRTNRFSMTSPGSPAKRTLSTGSTRRRAILQSPSISAAGNLPQSQQDRFAAREVRPNVVCGGERVCVRVCVSGRER